MRRILVLLVLIAIMLPINADEPDYFSIAESITADEIQELIDDGFDVNAVLPNGYLPLELATLYSSYDVISTLLDNGADINASGFDGNGTLFALIYRKAPISLDEAKELLGKVSDVDVENSYGYTPLFYAVGNNNLDAVSLLVEFGADVNRKSASGYAPILYATTPECITMLTEAGADPNVTVEYEDGEYSLLSLYISDYSTEHELAKALIEAGADVNFMDSYGTTPFSLALEGDAEMEFIDLMLEHGASAEYLNEELLEKLVGDVFGNPIDSDTLAYLDYVGYPLDMRDDEGMSLLMHSVVYSFPDVDIVSKLLEMGANPNARTLEGVTPLMLAAAYCSDTEIMEILINAGADVNARTEELATPLMASAANKNEDVVDFLIKAGADINAQDEDGNTALFYAADEAVNPAVIDVLLEAGADATIVNERGRKAFESAGEYSDVYRTPAFWRLVDASF